MSACYSVIAVTISSTPTFSGTVGQAAARPPWPGLRRQVDATMAVEPRPMEGVVLLGRRQAVMPGGGATRRVPDAVLGRGE
jgi:hypothetical protein